MDQISKLEKLNQELDYLFDQVVSYELGSDGKKLVSLLGRMDEIWKEKTEIIVNLEVMHVL